MIAAAVAAFAELDVAPLFPAASEIADVAAALPRAFAAVTPCAVFATWEAFAAFAAFAAFV